jgi:hypothetical protein
MSIKLPPLKLIFAILSLFLFSSFHHPIVSIILSKMSKVLAKAPKIHVAPQLPPVISFSSEEEPVLNLKFTLEDSDEPVTLALRLAPWIDEVNNIPIKNTSTGRLCGPGHIDICGPGKPPPLKRGRSQADQYLTLIPGQCYMIRYPFRPYNFPWSDDKRREQLHINEKLIMWARYGMHYLDPGAEYVLQIKDALCVREWVWGHKEEVLADDEDAAFVPVNKAVQIVPGPPVLFRVEA